jgi:hypothetical protein
MKLHILMWLLCSIILLATACKKQVDISANTANSTTAITQASSADFNAANFLFNDSISNPYLGFKPGTIFYYINTINEDGETSYEYIHVTVTSGIKKILGVNCTVVHDQVKEDGQITEDTYDWYAQDRFGNVWYFGEDTKARTDTGWSTEGSWEAGKHNALPGIAMFANPGAHLNLTYYQEFQRGVAEDQAQVINTNSSATVPYGSFNNCVKTKEFTRLDPTDIEHKYYAPGVGQVLTISATEREELISITHN